MKVFLKPMMSIFLAVVLLLSFAACEQQTAGTTAGTTTVATTEATTQETTAGEAEIRFTWWGNQSRHDATVAATELFMQRYPNIKVSAEPAGWDGFFDKLAVQIAAGNEPDLFQFDAASFIADYAPSDRLYSLAEFIGSEIDVTRVSGLDQGAYDGVQYCIPTAISGQGMCYNKTLFDTAGVPYPKNDWTWEDWEKACKDVMKGNPGTYGCVDIPLQQFDRNSVIIAEQKGATLVTEDLKVDAEEELVEIFTWYARLRDEGFFPPPDETVIKNTQQVNFFGLGLAATNPIPIAMATGEQANLGDKGKVGIAPMPGSSKQPSGVSLTGSNYLCIGKNSKFKNEAATYINFIINDAEAAKILMTVRGVPASSISRNVIKPVLSDVDKEVFSAADVLKQFDMPVSPVYCTKGAGLTFFTILREEGDTVAFKKATPEEAAKKAIERMQKSLDDAN